jgi:hypothetical protein
MTKRFVTKVALGQHPRYGLAHCNACKRLRVLFHETALRQGWRLCSRCIALLDLSYLNEVTVPPSTKGREL